jgi:hypothetical protein
MEQRMSKLRPRVKHEKTFQQRLADEAQRYKEAADTLPPGKARELLLRRIQKAKTAAHIDDWVKSPGLQPPKELLEVAGTKK